MKKTMLAVGVAAVILAGCTNDAEAETSVFGSVEQAWQSTNDVNDIVNGDTFVGVQTSEDLGAGLSAFAKVSLDIDSEGANGSTTKDAYVGVTNGKATVQAGRMTNVQGKVGDLIVDIFEGPGTDVANGGRTNNTIGGSLDLGGVTLLGSTTSDGASGEDGQDSYEVGATGSFGNVTLAGAYAKDQNTGTETTLYGASTNVSGATIGGTFETDETSAGVETDTYNVVGSVDLGVNTLKIGYNDVENGAETTTIEGVHNYSSKTSTYVNVQDVSTSDDKTWTVGVRVNF